METLVALFALLLLSVTGTLAAVLLVGLFAGAQPRGRKVLFAALGGAASLLLVILPLALLEATPTVEVFVFAAVILSLGGAIVGWPIAYFATRRLERLMRFATSTFE